MPRQFSLGGELLELVSIGSQQPGAMAVTNRLDFSGQVALGNVSGHVAVNKFGNAPNGVQITITDIWSRANADPLQQIWLAPTAPRAHVIASTSAADTAGSTGAGSVVVYGLPTWSTAETSGTYAIGGTTSAYAIIHRMKVLPQASTTSVGGNAGTITATAAVDSTVTAVIQPNDGQTEMAIYGVPSGKTLLLYGWYGAIDKGATAAVTVDLQMRVNENPDVQTLAYFRKADVSLQSTGTNAISRNFDPPLKFTGPCIVKVQGIGSAADIDVDSGFDAILVTP